MAGRALLVQRAADGDGWQWAPAPDTDRLTQWLAQHCNVGRLALFHHDPSHDDARLDALRDAHLVKRLRDARINAFLVGEAFMRADEPGEALAELFGE